MWRACVYPEEYLLLRYILTSLLLHTNRTIRAPYEVSIPYESIAPLCGLPIPSGTGGGLSLGSPKGHYKDPFPKSPSPRPSVREYPYETSRCPSIESLPLGFVRDEETSEELSPP